MVFFIVLGVVLDLKNGEKVIMLLIVVVLYGLCDVCEVLFDVGVDLNYVSEDFYDMILLYVVLIDCFVYFLIVCFLFECGVDLN